ncbi:MULTISPECIES: TnsD family transposase [unclassified Nostoc]|uniref:TnsD family transposase n=1 Tax=unclassified Nostoc TaxID=2593658 RepID=UPI001D82B25B|nr:TnsD family transposase [Nostoc sp. JL23]MBN3879588.1 TniQ family protein [Nostoc sp. JL23]
MIGFFPDPYPDELLYSACARYQERLTNISKESVCYELFGSKASAYIDIPGHLSYLIAVLPPGHSYTIDYLIDNHTLLPLYLPFLTQELENQLRDDMKGEDASKTYRHLGCSSNKVKSPDWLKFCPLCVEEDKKKFGECYWHRIHQVPGVFVCPLHEVFLENSNVPMRNRENRYNFFTAEKAVKENYFSTSDLLTPYYAYCLKIAHDVNWLLNQHQILPNSELLYNRYLYLVIQNKFSTYKGQLYKFDFVKAFANFYPEGYLKLLNCEVDENWKRNWIYRPLRPSERSIHPLRHLLLIHFFGYSVEEFFNLFPNLKPFGEGSWPCLNPTCKYFRQLKIKECQITHNNKKGRRPIGLFSCNCGFTYTRKGPDLVAEDKFCKSTVKLYGEVWEESLQNLWKDSSISNHELSRKLGVSIPTLYSQAKRLKLVNSHSDCEKPQQAIEQISQTTVKNRLENYRQELLSLLNENPESGRRALATKCPRVYGWLRKHDFEWLEAHLPPPQTKTKKKLSSSPDWAIRDSQLADAVKAIALQFKNIPGSPKRITKKAIWRLLNKSSLLKCHLHELPLTAKVMSEVIETHEEFSIRKIQWVAECYRQQNVQPQRHQFVNKFSSSYSRSIPNPILDKAIDDAMRSLELINNAGDVNPIVIEDDL